MDRLLACLVVGCGPHVSLELCERGNMWERLPRPECVCEAEREGNEDLRLWVQVPPKALGYDSWAPSQQRKDERHR